MTALVAVDAVVWPIERIGEAFVSLAREVGLIDAAAPAPRHPPGDPATLDRWMAAAGEQLGLAVEPVTAHNRDVDDALALMTPAVIRLPTGAIAVIRHQRGQLTCLAPDGERRRIARGEVAALLQRGHAGPHQARVDALLDRTALSPAARGRAEAGILRELLVRTVVLHGWTLRMPPGAPFARQVRAAGLLRLGGVLLGAHAMQYVLYLVSWWAIGAAVLA
ncbi:MAG TPA: hypothetical protein VFP84_37430, partial [Kofleriaceae bacterium]|nr:hypothetical protein [Kofleriaceae bacterium]